MGWWNIAPFSFLLGLPFFFYVEDEILFFPFLPLKGMKMIVSFFVELHFPFPHMTKS